MPLLRTLDLQSLLLEPPPPDLHSLRKRHQNRSTPGKTKTKTKKDPHRPRRDQTTSPPEQQHLKIQHTKLHLHPFKTSLQIMNPDIKQAKRLLGSRRNLLLPFAIIPPDNNTDTDNSNQDSDDDYGNFY
jgi:hypothetical protein